MIRGTTKEDKMKTQYRQETIPEIDDDELWSLEVEVDIQDLARVSGLDLLNAQEAE